MQYCNVDIMLTSKDTIGKRHLACNKKTLLFVVAFDFPILLTSKDTIGKRHLNFLLYPIEKDNYKQILSSPAKIP